MAEIKMKVIGREKKEVGDEEYSDFYLVQFPDYKDKLHKHTTYYGNGESGVLDSFLNIARVYDDGWETEGLEDLRDKNVPVPDKVKSHIKKLIDREEKIYEQRIRK